MKKLLASLTLLVACSTADIGRARKYAEDFAKNVDGATGVDCNDSDSDNDGYVSCTVFRKGMDPLPLSCGAERFCVFNCASGCKVTPFKTPTN